MPARVTIYTTPYCPYCVLARKLLRHKGASFEEVDVADDPARRQWLRTVTGRPTVPQVFIDERAVGGYDDLAALDAKGELDAMLSGAAG